MNVQEAEEAKNNDVKIEEIKSENLEKHWKFTIDSKNIESKYREELASIAKKISMPGFRPGKVPQHLIETRYSDTIYEDVSKKVIEETIQNFFKGKEQKHASTPNVEDLKNIKGENIEFVLKIEYLPQITMPAFEKIKLEKAILEIKEKDIESELKDIAEKNKKFDKKEGKAKKGDGVKIDFNGRIDGKEFQGGNSKDFFIELGSKSMIPGFEEQILGHKEGDEFTIKLKFPDDYHAKHLAGKDVEFDIKIHEVSTSSIPEINDEFVKEKFLLENLDELKKNIVKKLDDNYKEQIDIIIKMRLFDELENMLDFEVPKTLFQNEYNSLKAQMNNDQEFQDIVKNKSAEDLEKYYRKIVNRRVRTALLISEYAKLKNIEISSEELKSAVVKRAMSMPGYEKFLVDYYSKNPKATQELIGSALEDKVVKAIIENEIQLVEKFMSKDIIDKLIDEENNKDAII